MNELSVLESVRKNTLKSVAICQHKVKDLIHPASGVAV